MVNTNQMLRMDAVSRDVLVALLTGAVVGFSLAAAYFVSSSPKHKEQPAIAEAEDRRRSTSQEEAAADDEESDVEDEDPGAEPHKMVMVVNESLKMGKGKIAAQCCHACLGAYKRATDPAIAVWRSQGQAKIAVKARDEFELRKVAEAARANNVPFYLVADAGRTQIAAGSITVCAVGPAPVSRVDKITGQFKLL